MTDLKEQWLLSFSSGQKWLNTLSSDTTKAFYIDFFKRYCDAVQKTPDQLIELKIEGLKNTGELKEFIAEDLLESFFVKCEYSKNAKLQIRNSVMSFYKWNRRPLNPITAINVKNIPAPKKRTPIDKDILKLEANMSNAKSKAILWFIASTSCRIDTVTKLFWKDLKPTDNAEVPFAIEIEAERLKGAGLGKYKDIKQITFLHKLAYERLLEYKKEAQLKGYNLTESSPLFIAYYQKSDTEEKKIKALTDKAVSRIFNSASLNAWGDLAKKKFSPHDLRDYVQNALDSSSINPNIYAPILAHKIKGIDGKYSNHTVKEIMECYIKALPYLVPKTVSALETELKETETENKTQNKEIRAMREVLLTFVDRNTLEIMVNKKLESMPTLSASPELGAKIFRNTKNMNKAELMEYYSFLNERYPEKGTE
jgi:hypothetical protein